MARNRMTDFDRTLYKTYLAVLTDRELLKEKEIVYTQGELADPGLMLAISCEIDKRNSLASAGNIPWRC